MVKWVRKVIWVEWEIARLAAPRWWWSETAVVCSARCEPAIEKIALSHPLAAVICENFVQFSC